MSEVVDEKDDRFYVGASTIPAAGNGLFAKIALPVGAKLEVLGVRVERGSIADECTQFADAHKVRFGENELIIPLGFAGMVNHSARPNMEKYAEGDILYLRTTKPVAVGEELFFTYTEYAQVRFGFR